MININFMDLGVLRCNTANKNIYSLFEQYSNEIDTDAVFACQNETWSQESKVYGTRLAHTEHENSGD